MHTSQVLKGTYSTEKRTVGIKSQQSVGYAIASVVGLETIDEPVATNRDQLRWLMDMIGL